MGNIHNMNNFICENYYCQSVSFKPEWLSENSWNIQYKSINNDDKEINNKIENNIEEQNYIKENNNLIKPYKIEKGILKINNINKNQIILSKKLLINFNDIKNLLIPINFKYNIKNSLSSIDFFIIFSDKEYNLNNNLSLLKENNDRHFYIKLTFTKKYILLSNSFDTKLMKKKIKTNKIYRLNIDLENNYNMLLVTKNLINIFEEKYLIPFYFDDNNNYYLNLLVNINSNLSKKEYLELNFE